MATKKQKYYVVWQGHNPGIYLSWEKCNAQVKNYPNARYKAFDTKQLAEEAFLHGPVKSSKNSSLKKSSPGKKWLDSYSNSISVDAACSGNPGIMEYRGVWTADKTEIFHFGPVKDGTNNIGEFLAIVHALALLKKKNDSTTPIFSDSKIAISWVKKKKANTKVKLTGHNTVLFDMLDRAENWLAENAWKNPLLKWETESWGENPADFGRK